MLNKLYTKNKLTETEFMKDEGLVPQDLDIGPGPIHWNGWIKFIRYSNKTKGRPPYSFFENHQYFKQIKNNPYLDTSLIEGNINKYIKFKKDMDFEKIVLKPNNKSMKTELSEVFLF